MQISPIVCGERVCVCRERLQKGRTTHPCNPISYTQSHSGERGGNGPGVTAVCLYVERNFFVRVISESDNSRLTAHHLGQAHSFQIINAAHSILCVWLGPFS